MYGHATETAKAVFGWNPLWVSSVVFLVTYLMVITGKVNRAVVTLLGAGLMIALGVLNQDAAIRGVKFGTLGLLIGMMVIVSVARRSGLFQYVALWSVRKVRARP
jgi:Na+/H+ antiporter NhaD/arsenite permease-like protein